MGRPDFEELDVDKLFERLANGVWRIVEQWDIFAKDTVGKQMVRAADSICANIAVPAAFPKGGTRSLQL